MNRTRRLLATLAVLAVLAVAVRPAPAGTSPPDGPVVQRIEVSAVQRPFTDEQGRSVVLDRQLLIEGSGFVGTSFGPFVRVRTADDRVHEASMVVIESDGRLLAWPPPGLRGPVQVEVSNPDRRADVAPATL